MNIFFVILFGTLSIAIQGFGIYTTIFLWDNEISSKFGPCEMAITSLYLLFSLVGVVLCFFKSSMSNQEIHIIYITFYILIALNTILSGIIYYLICIQVFEYMDHHSGDYGGFFFFCIETLYSFVTYLFFMVSFITSMIFLKTKSKSNTNYISVLDQNQILNGEI